VFVSMGAFGKPKFLLALVPRRELLCLVSLIQISASYPDGISHPMFVVEIQNHRTDGFEAFLS